MKVGRSAVGLKLFKSTLPPPKPVTEGYSSGVHPAAPRGRPQRHGPCVYAVDAGGRVVFASTTLQEALGFTTQEVVGALAHELFHSRAPDGSPAPERDCAVCAILRQGGARRGKGESFHRKDGTQCAVDYFCSALFEADGSLRGALVSFQEAHEPHAAETSSRVDQDGFRQSAESAPLGAPQRLATVLDSITEAWFVLDAEGRFEYVNAEAARLLENPRDALIGQKAASPLRAALGDAFEEQCRRAQVRGVALSVEATHAKLGRWFEVRAYPSSAGLAVHLRDITERKRQRESLHTSEERFRLFAQAMNDAVWDWDLETGEIWWGEGIAKLFGYAPGDVLPTVDWRVERIHPEDRARSVESIQSALQAGHDAWSAEYRFLTERGTYAHVLDRGHIVRDGAGRPLRMIGGMTDLTEQKRVEEKLREQATLLDRAQDAILVRSLDQKILYWNRSAERLYGWSAGEVLGRSAAEVLYADRRIPAAAMDATLAKGEWTGELEQVTKSGQTVVVEGHWSLVRDEAGSPKAILAINTDITERKKLETQFLRAQRLESIGTLAGGIAHDLNNVFAPILLTSSLLRQDETDATRAQDLATIQSCAQRGADLVRQLVTFARGADGRRARVDLSAVAKEVELIVRDTFAKDIAFELSSASDLWRIKADETQMHQILTNLCVNARDAMPLGGHLRVSLSNVVVDEVFACASPDAAPGAYVLLEVQDTGAGMSAAVLDRVFEPFFTTKEAGRGTGLGLSTTQSIVRSHGGFIQVTSEVGVGTRFRVYLPAAPAVRSVLQPKRDDGTVDLRGRGELVLFVEDEAPLREAAQRALEGYGYRVLLASHGAEAVALYAEHRADVAVVVLDMLMPIMDGLATQHALRAMNPGVKIVTSCGLPGSAERAAEAGVSLVLHKPYTADAMLRGLREVLGRAELDPTPVEL